MSLRFRKLSSLILICALSCVPAFAQKGNWGEPQTPLAVGVEVPAGAPPEEMSPMQRAKLRMDLSTPRAMLTSFLNAMNDAQSGNDEFLTAALQCIYLLDLEEAGRIPQGTELAQKIHEALSSITLDLALLDDKGENPVAGTTTVDVTFGQDESSVTVYMRFNSDGVWRFSYNLMSEHVGELEDVVEVAEDAAIEVPVDPGVDPRIANPRATMQTFLGAFKEGYLEDGGWDDALATLDLSDIASNLQTERGQEFATLLKQILDRDREITFQEFPNAPTGTAVLVLVDPTDTLERRRIEIVPLPIAEGAEVFEWKFSAASLQLLQELWDNVYIDREPVAGLASDVPQVMSLQLRDWMNKNAPYLTDNLFLIENWKWLGLFISIMLGMIVSRVTGAFLVRVVRRVFRRKHFRIDEKLERGFVIPIRVAIMAWVWWIALKPLSLPDDALTWLKGGIITVSSTAFVWAVYRLVDILGSFIQDRATTTDNKYDDMFVPLIVRTMKIFVLAAGFIFVCQVNEYDITAILAGFGLAGMAIALAAQDTLGNIFGSLTVLMDRPFQIGDWIQIGDVDGSVESVGIRSTRIRTFYNSVVTVPNSELTTAIIDNYGARRYRRIKMNIGVTYNTPPEKMDAFCEGIRELVRQHPYTRKDYFHVYFNNFNSSSLDILLYCFVETPDWSTELRERHRLLLDIVRLAADLGVEFAFPTQTLYMQNTGDAADDPGASVTDMTALTEGRERARGIVRQYTGSEIPPPVTFNQPEDQMGLLDEEEDRGGE